MRSIFCLAMALLTVPAVVGCGGSSTSDDATGGNAGTGGSSGTGATGGGGSGGSGGIGGSVGGGGSGGSGGSTSCSGYEDEIPPPNVFTIRLKNDRSTAIYLGGGNDCGPAQLYELQGPSGPVQFFAGVCGNTCEELQKHGPYCTGACMMPLVIRIDPGGYYDESWSGTTYESMNMPASCYFQPDSASATCDRRIIAPAGTYAASATAGSDFTCPDLGTCTCEPSSSGSCELPYGGSPGGETLAAKASFEFPSTSMVEIVFQ